MAYLIRGGVKIDRNDVMANYQKNGVHLELFGLCYCQRYNKINPKACEDFTDDDIGPYGKYVDWMGQMAHSC